MLRSWETAEALDYQKRKARQLEDREKPREPLTRTPIKNSPQFQPTGPVSGGMIWSQKRRPARPNRAQLKLWAARVGRAE